MGKTAIASARVASLINAGAYAGNIHLLSFTKTAVKEIWAFEPMSKNIGEIMLDIRHSRFKFKETFEYSISGHS